jgi:hypothetical protein
MKLHTLPVSVSLAALIGAVHTYLLAWAWVYISIHTPWPHWLASHGATGASFQGTLFFTDFLTNMALCVPAAYLLCKLRPGKLWLYLVAAILPGILWQYRLVLGDITLLSSWHLFLSGVLLALLPLPATALLIRRFVTDAPNSSFWRWTAGRSYGDF